MATTRKAATREAATTRKAAIPRKAATKKSATKNAATKKTAAKKATGRREANKEATQQRIVDVALRLFEKNGFEATTTRAIARGAQVAEGTVFNYFQTKDDIALHFFEQEVDHAVAAVRANRSLRKAPLEEKLFALIQYQIDYLAPYEKFIGVALIQSLKPGSRIAFSMRALDLRARYLSFVQDLISESLPPARARQMSWIAPNAFWLFYVGILLYWLNDTSEGKQSTLAFLDRSLRMGSAFLQRGTL